MDDYFNVSKEKWQKCLSISDNEIPEKLIIEGHINYPKLIEKRGQKLSDVKNCWMPNLIMGKYQGQLIGYGVCFGGPIASQFAHIYCKMGTKKIIQIGICGGLQDYIELGDIIVSGIVLSMDGSAKLYKQKSNIVTFDENLKKKVIQEFEKRKIKYHVGKTVSYFDILLEEKKDLIELSKSGYLAVEMEAATTCSVANFFGVPAISFFVVSDNSMTGKDLFYKMTKKEKDRIEEGKDNIFDVALNI